MSEPPLKRPDVPPDVCWLRLPPALQAKHNIEDRDEDVEETRIRAEEAWGLNSSDCLPSSAVFVEVLSTRCSRTTDSNGTLRFVYSARVRSSLLPFLSRDMVLNLELARDGRVVRFP